MTDQYAQRASICRAVQRHIDPDTLVGRWFLRYQGGQRSADLLRSIWVFYGWLPSPSGDWL
jgi:hypothetical protein